MKEVIIIGLICCTVLFAALYISTTITAEYTYINTEHTGGALPHTLIYEQNGEVKYLHYSDPATEIIFRKLHGMADND